VSAPEHYDWSAVRTHCSNLEDPLLDCERHLDPPTGDWTAWLRLEPHRDTLVQIRRGTATGHPVGSEEFVARLEDQLKRRLTQRKYVRRKGQIRY